MSEPRDYRLNLGNREEALERLGRVPVGETSAFVKDLLGIVWDQYEAGNLSLDSEVQIGHWMAHVAFVSDPVVRERRAKAREAMS